jgi:hypothetical protein
MKHSEIKAKYNVRHRLLTDDNAKRLGVDGRVLSEMLANDVSPLTVFADRGSETAQFFIEFGESIGLNFHPFNRILFEERSWRMTSAFPPENKIHSNKDRASLFRQRCNEAQSLVECLSRNAKGLLRNGKGEWDEIALLLLSPERTGAYDRCYSRFKKCPLAFDVLAKLGNLNYPKMHIIAGEDSKLFDNLAAKIKAYPVFFRGIAKGKIAVAEGDQILDLPLISFGEFVKSQTPPTCLLYTSDAADDM